MKDWYRKLLHLQKPYHLTRNLVSVIKLIVICGLVIAAIAAAWMRNHPALAWAFIGIAVCVGTILIIVLIRYDLKNRKQFDQYWEDQIKAQEAPKSPKS